MHTGERVREKALWLLLLYVFSSTWACPMQIGLSQECCLLCLFCLKSSLWSSDLPCLLATAVLDSFSLFYLPNKSMTLFVLYLQVNVPWCIAAAAAAKSLQSCPTLCYPIDGSPPGSPVPGILQARTLEWVAISFSNAWKWKVKVKSLSRVQLLATPWSAAYQAPPSMGFSRQEYWSRGPSPSLDVLL